MGPRDCVFGERREAELRNHTIKTLTSIEKKKFKLLSGHAHFKFKCRQRFMNI